ncbi:hypothetical protein B0O99DRAFT_747744 [Bisporella sp. PMI_857]|nr:hypothetical protein B0O99DRAFT_747744 [Bisporella sp. PMI_857]
MVQLSREAPALIQPQPFKSIIYRTYDSGTQELLKSFAATMPDKDLRLLALDGGGVRGLSALIILQQLMETIDPENPPKPCDYFDMIGGTSTGGLIAIMLGRLKMSIDDCIDAYLSLSDRIFQKKRHCVTVKGNIQGRFDSEELVQAVKEVVAAQKLKEDALLKDLSDNACKVFVCATSKETSETICLSSYKSPCSSSDLLNSVKIWEACRATSAASSFFDAIAVGRFGEEFVDGATGANNPVWEVWNQAQLLWGPQPLEEKIKCLVSIGTGVPSLKPFRDDVLHFGETLVSIATETEQTAERFRRDKAHLDDRGQYYRFNVDRGLEEIGLEESKKRKEIAAATRRYVGSQGVFKQMQACADNMTGREYFGEYRTVFSLKGVPRVSKFIERPAEIAELERVLLPEKQSCRQKRFVLHGLGGIGKTQLAVEFASRYQRRFSGVFWLDGRSKDSVMQSIASCASRIPEGQISQSSKTYAAGSNGDINIVVQEVIGWLAREDNVSWLLVFDNVDRDYGNHASDSNAYDVMQYFTGANHGSVLITTRLAKLEQLGDSQRLGNVNQDQARAILQSRYHRKYNLAEGDRLLGLLDGLPLAIAQAAAFLQETGTELQKYIEFYEEKWKELMESGDWEGAPLQDYPDRSVWTTWAISYDAIRKTHIAAANFLLLWAFLDRKDLWYGLFAAACNASTAAASSLSEWIGSIAGNELELTKAVRLFRNYSLIEDVKDCGSYATHPVVHRWAYHFQGEGSRQKLAQLAVIIVGCAVPDSLSRDYSTLQRRLLPHAQACSHRIEIHETGPSSGAHKGGSVENQMGEERIILDDAILLLGNLYRDQGKLDEAEKMYQRALQGYEMALGAEHTSTLTTVNNLGNLYTVQGKLDEAEKMYQRALQGYEMALGAEHTSTLNTVNNLGNLYRDQGKLDEAEKMCQRALQGYDKALGAEHTSTLNTVNNLGLLYADQGKLDEAEKMCQRALQGYEKALGAEHTSTLRTVNNLGILYKGQGKLDEAEKMYQRALQGYEMALGAEHTSTLNTVNNLGLLYADQGKLDEAEKMYQLALQGYEKALGAEHTSTLTTVNNLGLLYRDKGKLDEAEKMCQLALQGYEKALGAEHTSTLTTVNNLGLLYRDKGKLDEAEKMCQRALQGFEKALGAEHTSTLNTVNNLGLLYADQGKLDEAEKMYQRALQGFEMALGAEHTSTLRTVNNLGILYKGQGKLDEAEKMYQRALQGYEMALGAEHTSTLNTVNNLGILYKDKGKLDEAEKIYQRALQGYEMALGAEHTSTLNTVNNLGLLYADQGKLDEAEKMCQRALQGYEKALGAEHTSTLTTLDNLGTLYKGQGKLDEAEKMYQRALQGYEMALGAEHTSTLNTVNNLGLLYADQGKLDEAEKMCQRALQGYEKALGANFETYIPALNTIWGLAYVFERQANLSRARIMYSRALNGYEKAVGPDHSQSKGLGDKLRALDAVMDSNASEEAEEPPITFQEEGSHLGARQRPPKSRRRNLLNKLGFR